MRGGGARAGPPGPHREPRVQAGPQPLCRQVEYIKGTAWLDDVLKNLALQST